MVRVRVNGNVISNEMLFGPHIEVPGLTNLYKLILE